jgi:hypothetical protein
MTVVANILDPVHDTVDPSVWDSVHEHYPVLKPQHKDWITDTVLSTLKRHGYGDMDKWLDLYITGSLTTFQYSDDSDCDVSLFVNTDVFPEWSRAEMIGIMVSEIDGTTLPGTTHPMQCFVVAKGIRPEDLYKPGLRSGYQIGRDRWVVPPERERAHDVARSQNADYQYALEQADKMDRLLRYEPQKAVQFWHQIHLRRMSDQRAGKGDYSQSNIIYKFLSNRGLFPKIEEVSGEHIATKLAWTPEAIPPPTNLDDHWLTWQPGQEGKGFILSNGRVWHWPTENMRPMHMNKSAIVKHLGGQVRSETAFHIKPDGGIWQYGPGRHLDHWDLARLAMADHRLKPGVAPSNADEYGHSQAIYDKLKTGKTAAFFNDEHPNPDAIAEFGPEWDLERQRRNELRALPNVMYHVAPTNRRENIALNGLVPDAERINNESGHEPGVYLWEDPEVAMKYRGQGPNQFSDFDMYAVQVPREHLRPDPWFEHNHQDRAADFPGAWYMPSAVPSESIHPFYDSPWHPRTAAAPNPWSVDHAAIEKARRHLDLHQPVKINLVKGTHGQYHGLGPEGHEIDVVSWLKPESASKQIWHEMTHALQHEKDPHGFQHGMQGYWDAYDQSHQDYLNHPWEIEARQNAEAHPFPLVHGLMSDNSSPIDAPTTNEGIHVGQAKAHDTSQPPSEEAWSFC